MLKYFPLIPLISVSLHFPPAVDVQAVVAALTSFSSSTPFSFCGGPRGIPKPHGMSQSLSMTPGSAPPMSEHTKNNPGGGVVIRYTNSLNWPPSTSDSFWMSALLLSGKVSPLLQLASEISFWPLGPMSFIRLPICHSWRGRAKIDVWILGWKHANHLNIKFCALLLHLKNLNIVIFFVNYLRKRTFNILLTHH